jgi:hypothetical protein
VNFCSKMGSILRLLISTIFAEFRRRKLAFF